MNLHKTGNADLEAPKVDEENTNPDSHEEPNFLRVSKDMNFELQGFVLPYLTPPDVFLVGA